MPEEPQRTKKPKERSPSYPGVDLERAIDLARIILEKTGQHDTVADVVWQHWGMRPKTGPAAVALAALKKFGLLDVTGHKVRLSALAIDILLDNREGSILKQERVREAALKPSIHQELWEKYDGSLPSDGDLRWHLTRERVPPFTTTGADGLITEFRRTISFAGLTRPELPSQPTGDKLAGEKGKTQGAAFPSLFGGNMFPAPAKSVEPAISTQEIQFSIPGPISALIRMPSPLTEEDWRRMMAVIEAMKPPVMEPKRES